MDFLRIKRKSALDFKVFFHLNDVRYLAFQSVKFQDTVPKFISSSNEIEFLPTFHEDSSTFDIPLKTRIKPFSLLITRKMS